MREEITISDLNSDRVRVSPEPSSRPSRKSIGYGFAHLPFPALVVLCTAIFILDMAVPLVVYAYRHLFADVVEIILLVTTMVSGFIGIVTGIAIGRHLIYQDR